MDWDAVCEEAKKYIEHLSKNHPDYVDEMRGVADGAGKTLLDILALNVRTEITFGLFTLEKPTPPIDGCTSLAYKVNNEDSVLAQNWDWQVEQTDSLFICHVSPSDLSRPKFVMVTEGGIIGKIGFNSEGVGVCMNAIRARGLIRSKLPVHLAMRSILESTSRQAATDRLESTGVAGSVHLLIADQTGSMGLECTSFGIKQIPMDQEGKVVHANHLVLEHPEVDEPPWLEDSPVRTARMDQMLSKKLKSSPNFEELFELFKDEQGYPAAINRCQIDGCETQTLFTIMMNLAKKSATVTFGRPSIVSERIQLSL